MNSETTRNFRLCFAKLPKQIQELTRKNYYLWLEDNTHPSIHFKQVHNTEPIFSARVGINYRALGVKEDDTIVWFWIGSHSDYDNLLKQI
jgi:hypothetical protein